jgi:hypothetical protein
MAHTTSVKASAPRELTFTSSGPLDRCSLCGNAHARGVYVKSTQKLWSFTICETCVMAIKIAEEGS